MIGRTVGSYVIESKIGQGGMGEVYLGRHGSLDTLAAIKVMAAVFSHDDHLRKRFSREAKTQAQLRHPHVAQVLDHVEVEGRWFLIIEYLPQGTLADRLTVQTSISVDQAVTWVRQGLAGLHYAHGRSIVHRDVKPANLLLNERVEVAVTDFGIALEAGVGRLTRTGSAIGTPEYMSPEQIRGVADLDLRTDLYSMGIVLYELLGGRVPFSAESMFEVQRAQVSDPPPPLRDLVPALPEALDAVVSQALEKDRRARFQDASAFARALEPFAGAASAGVTPVGVATVAPSSSPVTHRQTLLEPIAESRPVPAVSPVVDSSPRAPWAAANAVPEPSHQPTMVLQSSPAAPDLPTTPSTAPQQPKPKRWRWVLAAGLTLAIGIGVGNWKGPRQDSDPSQQAGVVGLDDLQKRVVTIEDLEQQAGNAARKAGESARLAEAGRDDAVAQAENTLHAVSRGSCELAANHAGRSSVHAQRANESAQRASGEADRAAAAAEKATAVAADLEIPEQASVWWDRTNWELTVFSGVALAAGGDAEGDVEMEAVRRRGLESSQRAGEAAAQARSAAGRAGVAAREAEKAALKADGAAAGCRPREEKPKPEITRPVETPIPPPRNRASSGSPPAGPNPPLGTLPDQPVVAVLATGDPLLAATVEGTLEKRLRRGGFDVRDELASLELADLIDRRGPDVSMKEMLPILAKEGFHVIVMIQVEEGDRRTSRLRGQHLSATAARVRLNAHLLPMRRSLGRGWSERVEYTELSAEAKGKQALIGATAELIPAIREGWSALKSGR